MDSTRSDRVAELFAAALGLDPGDRPTFLDRECGPDDALRAEVLDLLDQDERADREGFLGSPTRALGPDAHSPEPTGVPGRFVDLREPRRGGMGVVYRARDLELGRDVAYKVMNAAGLDLEAFRRRFAREARVTARLQYPGVVPVFALTLDGCGRPAYAMQYVEGVDFRELVPRRDPSTPPGEVPGRDRLEAFLAACRIVGFAHRKGYVHGDLSPNNLMIARGDGELDSADRGAVFVVDWGLARRVGTAGPDLDEVDGPLPGSPEPATPHFAAPSILKGGPRTFATDVYSLGAILACLARGVAPGGRPDLEALRRGAVPRPLRAIVEAAMLDRDGGIYPDAGALADDVRRLLDGEAVRADAEPWRERAWRSIRRHPARATVAVASVLLISVASTLAAWLAEARERSARLGDEARHARELIAENQIVAAITGGDSYRSHSVDPSAIASNQLVPLLRLIQYTAPQPRVREVAAELIRTTPDRLKDLAEMGERADEANRKSLEELSRQAVRMLEEMARDHPERRDVAWRWAYCELTLGQLEAARELGAAREAVGKSLLGRLTGKNPAQAGFERALARIDGGLDRLAAAPLDRAEPDLLRLIQRFSWEMKSLLLLQLSRYSEALFSLDRAMAFNEGKEQSWWRGLRLACLLGAEQEQAKLPWSRPPNVDHPKALRIADRLAEDPEVSPEAVYNAACAHALAGLDPHADPKECERRSARAVALLARIEAKGYFREPRKAKELAADPDLNPLRARDDFKALAAKAAPGG